MYIPIASKITHLEKTHIHKLGYLFSEILRNEKLTPLTVGFLGPSNSGKSYLLDFIQRMNQNDYICIKYSSWDYNNTNELWISIMYKLMKFIRLNIGFWRFYFTKFCMQFRFIRFFILISIQLIMFYILSYFMLTSIIIQIGYISLLTSSFIYYLFFTYETSIHGLNIFKRENYKNMFTLSRRIQYDIDFFMTQLLTKHNKKIICLLDDMDKTSTETIKQLFEFMTMIKRTKLPIIIVYFFDCEVMNFLMSQVIPRNDVSTFIDNHMDILIHIPLINPSGAINIVSKNLEFFDIDKLETELNRICKWMHNNIPILYDYELNQCKTIYDYYTHLSKKYVDIINDHSPIQYLNDFILNYKIIHQQSICFENDTKYDDYNDISSLFTLSSTRKIYNIIPSIEKYIDSTLFIGLKDFEKNVFIEISPYFSTDITKNKKCIILYKLSTILCNNTTTENELVNIIKTICLFEIWPCRMCLLYFLVYTFNDKASLSEYVSQIETYIVSKYTYKLTLDINRRDFPKQFFRNVLFQHDIKSSDFMKILPYILNINYSLKSTLESYL